MNTIVHDLDIISDITKDLWITFYGIWLLFVIMMCADYCWYYIKLRIHPEINPFDSFTSKITTKVIYVILLIEIFDGILAMVFSLLLLFGVMILYLYA